MLRIIKLILTLLSNITYVDQGLKDTMSEYEISLGINYKSLKFTLDTTVLQYLDKEKDKFTMI